MGWSEWFEENACLGILYCSVSTLSVKTTCTTSAVKLLSSASQHLWMTSSLASQKQSAEFFFFFFFVFV